MHSLENKGLVKKMVSLQPLFNAFKKNDPKAINEALSTVAQERRQQIALERALRTCGERGLEGDDFWACTDIEYKKELEKPARVLTSYSPETGAPPT